MIKRTFFAAAILFATLGPVVPSQATVCSIPCTMEGVLTGTNIMPPNFVYRVHSFSWEVAFQGTRTEPGLACDTTCVSPVAITPMTTTATIDGSMSLLSGEYPTYVYAVTGAVTVAGVSRPLSGTFVGSYARMGWTVSAGSWTVVLTGTGSRFVAAGGTGAGVGAGQFATASRTSNRCPVAVSCDGTPEV